MNNYKQTPDGIFLPLHEIIVPKGHILFIQKNIYTGRVTKSLVKNLVTTAGKNMIAAALIGQSNKYITYCAAGTNNTAPALGDTQLGGELGRKQISVSEISSLADNTAVFTTFFNTSEVNGALKEFGLFGGAASGTANSGTLVCRALENRTKTSADTLTLVWSVVIG